MCFPIASFLGAFVKCQKFPQRYGCDLPRTFFAAFIAAAAVPYPTFPHSQYWSSGIRRRSFLWTWAQGRTDLPLVLSVTSRCHDSIVCALSVDEWDAAIISSIEMVEIVRLAGPDYDLGLVAGVSALTSCVDMRCLRARRRTALVSALQVSSEIAAPDRVLNLAAPSGAGPLTDGDALFALQRRRVQRFAPL
jgi:hypothetical protein